MQIGLLYPSTELVPSSQTVRAFATAAEALGYDYIAVGDHVLGASRDRDVKLWGPYDDTDGFHDPFMLISNMAALTRRISFVTSVLILPQRQTALVAQQAADAAILSDNRLRLGVGVGWSPIEYDALGQSFTERGHRADEQIPLLRRLWREPLVTHDGSTERIDRAALVLRPTQDIPVWVGGNSEPAFRRAAAHGDGFIFAGSADNALRGLTALTTRLTEAGRDLEGFGLELVLIPPAPGRGSTRWPKERPEALSAAVDTARRWQDAGGTHVTVFTTWLGLDSLDSHLSYAERAARDLSMHLIR